MKKMFLVVLICFCFISCGNSDNMQSSNEQTTVNTKEYQIVLEDVFDVLELSEMEEFIERYGKNGYFAGNELFPNPSFYKENIYLDKKDFIVSYEESENLKQNSVNLTGEICTEELMQEFVEQFESYYSIKMESNEKWESGTYMLQNFCKQEEIIYYLAFMKYDGEKEIVFGIVRGDDQILEEEYKRLSE